MSGVEVEGGGGGEKETCGIGQLDRAFLGISWQAGVCGCSGQFSAS